MVADSGDGGGGSGTLQWRRCWTRARLWLVNGQVERQGKLSQGTRLQCWCGQGAVVQGAAGGDCAVAQVARARQRELRWLGRGKKMK